MDRQISLAVSLRSGPLCPIFFGAMTCLAPVSALAGEIGDDKMVAWQAEYFADGVAVASGGDTGSRYVGLANISADVSLEKAVGWQGAHLFVRGLSSHGGRPNDIAGTVQGIDNIEVSRNRARVFELFIDQEFADGAGSIRVGFDDLNSEFDANA